MRECVHGGWAPVKAEHGSREEAGLEKGWCCLLTIFLESTLVVQAAEATVTLPQGTKLASVHGEPEWRGEQSIPGLCEENGASCLTHPPGLLNKVPREIRQSPLISINPSLRSLLPMLSDSDGPALLPTARLTGRTSQQHLLIPVRGALR